MKQNQLLTALAALVLLFASCKSNKDNLSIPKDAAFVFHINTKALASKLSWDEIKSSAWFQEAYQKTPDAYAQKLMNNPDSSGIDMREDLAFFIQRRGQGGYGVFEGSVKDAAAFEAFCKKMSNGAQTTTAGDWKMLSANTSSVVAWNDDRFAFISDMPLGGLNPMNNDSLAAVSPLSADSLKLIAKEILSVSGSSSLFDDERFSSLIKEEGDMHIWANSGALYSDMAGMMAMMKMGSLLSESVSASTVHFEEGKISVKSKNFMGKEMQDMMDEWKSQKVEASVINRIPSDNVIGVIAANINPQSLLDFLKAIGLDGLMNMMLAKQNITINEVVAATKGQFVMAFSDLAMQRKTMVTLGGEGDTATNSFTTNSPDMTLLFATNVNKRPSFENVLKALTAEQPVLPFTYKLDDNWFVAANKPETVDAFFAGKTTSKPFADRISGHPFGMYLDLQRLLKTISKNDVAASAMLNEATATWQDVIATGGEVKDGAIVADFVMNMMDKKTNSLKQINRFIEKMYQSSKKNKVAFETPGQGTDTASAVPPVALPQ